MSFYIYKHILNNEVVYIGKTTNMKNRQKQHSKEKEWFVEGIEIKYTEVDNKTIMDIYELYYINKLKPKYNIVANRKDNISSLKLIDLVFVDYEFNIETSNKNMKEIINTEVYRLDNFESKLIIRALGFLNFKYYVELVLISKNNKLIGKSHFKKIDNRKLKNLLEKLLSFDIISYKKVSPSLYDIKFNYIPYENEILDLEVDFYENYEMDIKEFILFFISYSYNLFGTTCNPVMSHSETMCGIVMNCAFIDCDEYKKLKDKLYSKYNYSCDVGFKNTELYKDIKKFHDYEWGTLGYFTNEEDRLSFFSKFDDEYHNEFKQIKIAHDKYFGECYQA